MVVCERFGRSERNMLRLDRHVIVAVLRFLVNFVPKAGFFFPCIEFIKHRCCFKSRVKTYHSPCFGKLSRSVHGLFPIRGI